MLEQRDVRVSLHQTQLVKYSLVGCFGVSAVLRTPGELCFITGGSNDDCFVCLFGQSHHEDD